MTGEIKAFRQSLTRLRDYVGEIEVHTVVISEQTDPRVDTN